PPPGPLQLPSTLRRPPAAPRGRRGWRRYPGAGEHGDRGRGLGERGGSGSAKPSEGRIASSGGIARPLPAGSFPIPGRPMSTELALVLVLLAAAIAMFAINRPRMDAVALIMLTVLPFTGVLTMGEALAGFSDANIVLIAALFVIGDGLVRTGVARRLG